MSSQEDNQYITENLHQTTSDASSIAILIDTEKVINKIEMYLRSQRVAQKFNPQTNMIEEELVNYGSPACNEAGINGILNIAESIVNPQNVLGNFPNDWEMYNNYIADAREHLIISLIINRSKWNIDADNSEMITENVMNIVKPFMTRLIGNEERKMHAQGTQRREVFVRNQGRGSGQQVQAAAFGG